MKRDMIAAPLLPFTEDEETALAAKLNALDPAALGHYVDSARLSLGNDALDPSWRPRIQFGLDQAEAVLLTQSLAPPAPAQEPPPAAKARKVAASA